MTIRDIYKWAEESGVAVHFEYDYYPSAERVISDYVNYVSEKEIDKHM